MSERLFPYRRRPSESFEKVRDEAQNSRFFVLQSIGPTGFVLRDETDHNPLCWQASLTEAEIAEALRAREREEEKRQLEVKRAERRRAAEAKKAARQNSKTPDQVDCHKKNISGDDMCPICYEPLLAENAREEHSKEHQIAMRMLTFCMAECGNALHSQCMKVWADHRAQLGEDISCPLCRGKWPFHAIIELRRGASLAQQKQSTFWGRSCKQCHMQPLRGVVHGCLLCDPPVQLCETCFLHPTNPTHTKHPFVKCCILGGPWTPALRTVHDNMQLFRFREQHEQRRRQELASILAERELGPEDYELLQGLDRPSSTTMAPAVVAVDAEETLLEFLLRIVCEHEPSLPTWQQQQSSGTWEPQVPLLAQGCKPTVASILGSVRTVPDACACASNGNCIDSAPRSRLIRLRCGHSAHNLCLKHAFESAFETNANEILQTSWVCPTCGKALLPGWTALGLVEQACPRNSGSSHANHTNKSPQRATAAETLSITGGGLLSSNSTSVGDRFSDALHTRARSASSSQTNMRPRLVVRRAASAGSQQNVDLAVGSGPPISGPSDETLARRARIQPLSEFRLRSCRPRSDIAESNGECLNSALIVNESGAQIHRRPPRAPSHSRPSHSTQH